MISIGLDAHRRFYMVAFYDPSRSKIPCYRIRGGMDQLVTRLREWLAGRPCQICFEASCDYGPLYDHLRQLTDHVVVAHPGKLRLIWQSKRKHDRMDATQLAKLLSADLIPSVHVPSEAVRAWRRLIEHRRHLVNKRTRTKSALRSLLRGCGIQSPRQLWSQSGLSWLSQMSLPTVEDTLQRDMLVEDLRHTDTLIRRVTSHLNQKGAAHPGIELLRTIPGVGPRTAESFIAYIDDPHRFGRLRQIGAYLGLVPCQDQSSSRNHLGHITREGPSLVRGLLVEASWMAVRRDASWREYFERVVGADPDRKKIAIVATAHRMARIMGSMLRTGECWRSAA